MILQDVTLPFRAGLVHFITILTEEIFGCFQDREIELWDLCWGYGGMSLGQMVYEHSSPLEAQHAGLALVDEPVQISRGDLRE